MKKILGFVLVFSCLFIINLEASTTRPSINESIMCTAQYDPVCGVDGKTYSNSCNAKVAGVDVKHKGICGAATISENGMCGTANGGTFSTVPTSGLCSIGNPSSVYGYGPWKWTCSGVNGGSSASCSANKTASPVNASCGLANGGSYVNAPTSGLCSVGSASNPFDNGSSWVWTCSGFGGGSPASCSAKKIIDTEAGGSCIAVYDPVCGVDGKTYSNSCNAKVAGVDVKHEGVCETGSVNKPEMPKCGSAHGKVFNAKPVENLCAIGTPSTVFGDNPWIWRCQSGINSVTCDTQEVRGVCITVYDPVCGVDGKTYPNSCEAKVAGVDVKHEGVCNSFLSDNIVDCTNSNNDCIVSKGEMFKIALSENATTGYAWVIDYDVRTLELVKKESVSDCDSEARMGCGSKVIYYFKGKAFGEFNLNYKYRRSWEESSIDEKNYKVRVVSEEVQSCPKIYDPVCGADGKTYDSDCIASKNNIQVSYKGRCSSASYSNMTREDLVKLITAIIQSLMQRGVNM